MAAKTSAPVVAPIAHVAPGSAHYNLLCAPGVAGIILGDFERNGTVDHTDAEYLARLKRPGAILLPNLDIDDLSRVPSPPPADMKTLLDCNDDRVNGNADQRDLSLIKVRTPDPCSASASRVVIRVHAADAKRIRLFQAGAGPDPVLGAGKPSGPRHELVLPTPTPPNPFAFDYLVEALTLPGDPSLPAPTGASPNQPVPFPAHLPPGSSGAPIHAERAPADVWVEIVHQSSTGNDVPVPRDIAVLTIAPFLLLSNLHSVQQVYVLYHPRFNHEFVYDLAEGLNAALGGIAMPPDTSAPFVPHRPPYDPLRTPSSTPGKLYLIDGKRFPDQWVQDEMEIGYCWAPHGWMHVVLHLKRGRPLKDYLHKEMPAPEVGLFDGLCGAGDSLNFGGNLEVSPPVAVATPAIAADESGPAVKAHPKAPFGKILVGDCSPRPIHPDFRDFLLAQKVQPVFPIDTSWLQVGHVDEIMSFVPSSEGRGFCLLFASVQMMNALLQAAAKVPLSAGSTGFHRGKFEKDARASPNPEYAERSIEDYLAGPVRTYSETVRQKKLIPIEERLIKGLDIKKDEIIRFPTYFKVPAAPADILGTTNNRTVAETVGSVNMLVANHHLMIPRPFGPRLPAADCQRVLEEVFTRFGYSPRVTVRLPPDTGFWFWAFPGESLDRLARYFVRPPTAAGRLNVIDNIKTGAPLSARNAARVAAMKTAILTAPNNVASPALTDALSSPTADDFVEWKRVWIPEQSVDLIEAYMLSMLEPHGLTLHFIDDFHCYHIGSGEVHCGTNARREPPELTSPGRWWDDYEPALDLSYDPSRPSPYP